MYFVTKYIMFYNFVIKGFVVPLIRSLTSKRTTRRYDEVSPLVEQIRFLYLATLVIAMYVVKNS